MADFPFDPIFEPTPLDAQPHIVTDNKEVKVEEEKKTKRVRKSVKTREPKPRKPRTRIQRTDISGPTNLPQAPIDPNLNTGVPTPVPEPFPDLKQLEELRNELKFLVLKQAENDQLSDEEIKRELARVARIRDNDLKFELEKMRIKCSSSWTKNLAKAVTEGFGSLCDMGLRANGHISNEFKEDKNLHATVHGQLENYAFTMSPSSRIALLSFTDVVKGYIKKRAEQAVLENQKQADLSSLKVPTGQQKIAPVPESK